MKVPFRGVGGLVPGATGLPCDVAQQQITLLVYGEISGENSRKLEQHLATCPGCREELAAMDGLARAMAILPVQDPSPSLLAESRIRLEEALDALPPRGWAARLRGMLRNNINLLRTAPVAAAALLFAGVAVGGYGGFLVAGGAHVPPNEPTQPAAQSAAPAIAEVNSVAEQPGTGNVTISYGKVVPAEKVGSPQDPEIRQLLVAGARIQNDPAVQEKSVSLLAAACQNGQACAEDDAARHALMVALRYDPSPDIRHKALNALQPYVPEDTHVRDAVLESVLDDGDPGVRSAAMDMLQPVGSDSSVQQVLQRVATRDGNPRMRTFSRELLHNASQIQ